MRDFGRWGSGETRLRKKKNVKVVASLFLARTVIHSHSAIPLLATLVSGGSTGVCSVDPSFPPSVGARCFRPFVVSSLEINRRNRRTVILVAVNGQANTLQQIFLVPVHVVRDEPDVLVGHVPLPLVHVPRLVGVAAAGGRADQGTGAALAARLGHEVARLLKIKRE